MAKKKLTNLQIANIIGYTQSKDYFQNYNDKISARLSWVIRKNISALMAIATLIEESEKELIQKYRDAGHVKTVKDTDGNDQEIIEQGEAAEQFIKDKNELYSQVNTVKIKTVSPELFIDLNMKDRDWDVMSFMIDEDAFVDEDEDDDSDTAETEDADDKSVEEE